MAITSRDQLIAALPTARRVIIDKASIANAVAGRFYSLWRATGQPAQAAIPTTQAVCNSALLGALPLVNGAGAVRNHIGLVDIATANATSAIEFHDRLCHQGGLSGTVTTAQTTNLPLTLVGVSQERIGAVDYSDVSWWLEWYTDTGATGVNATVAVTYDDDTTGNIVVALSATSRASGLYQIGPLAAGKKGIKAVTSVTLSATTGTAGAFGVTASRYLTGLMTAVSYKTEICDWANLGLPLVANDACLMLTMLCVTTTTGIVKAVATLPQG